MNFEELMNWVKNNINLTQKKNYQIVMLLALLENNEHRLTKKEIQEELRRYNPEHNAGFYDSTSTAAATLQRNKVVEPIEGGKSYQLILEQPLSEKERSDLIEYCSMMIEKGPEKILEERNRQRYILPELEEFLDKVDTKQLQVLRQYQRKAGKNFSAAKIRGSGKKDERLELASVDGPFLMHHLNSGVYYPAGTGYAQAIYLNPDSRWELEVDREHPTLKINYNFSNSENPEHRNAKNYLTKCYDIGLPIGILFRLTDNRFKCLGLGKITSIDGNSFVIESSPSHTPEESTKLKDQVLEEYDEITKDESVSRVPDAN